MDSKGNSNGDNERYEAHHIIIVYLVASLR